MIIRVPEQQEDLAKRSSIQVVKTINRAIGIESTLVVHKLPSRDTVITFDQTTETFIKDTK